MRKEQASSYKFSDRSVEPYLSSKHDTNRLPHRDVDIGPHSLLWKYLGDPRIGLTGMSAGILQLMHPEVGAGVAEHSKFFDDPWGRVLRSLPEIVSVVYAPNGKEIGRRIRKYHDNIQGKDDNNRAYHALSPETFWWPHATFHHMVEDLIDRFDPYTLNPAGREQLYQETNTWYARYGVSTRPIPKNYAAFRKKWDDICTNTLELTPAAQNIIEAVTTRTVTPFPEMPMWVWEHGGRLPMNECIRVLAIGGLPEIVRERFNIPWSLTDKGKLKLLENSGKGLWRVTQYGFQERPDDLFGMLQRLDKTVVQRVE